MDAKGSVMLAHWSVLEREERTGQPVTMKSTMVPGCAGCSGMDSG